MTELLNNTAKVIEKNFFWSTMVNGTVHDSKCFIIQSNSDHGEIGTSPGVSND